MRSIVAGLTLALVIVAPAHAQQLAISTPTPTTHATSTPATHAELRPVEATTAAIQVEPTPPHTSAIEVSPDVDEASAAQSVSARTVLAIIGAVVVVVALVALFS